MKLTFEQWLRALDKLCIAKIGLNHDDLPDSPTRRWYDEGKTPTAAFKSLLKHARQF